MIGHARRYLLSAGGFSDKTTSMADQVVCPSVMIHYPPDDAVGQIIEANFEVINHFIPVRYSTEPLDKTFVAFAHELALKYRKNRFEKCDVYLRDQHDGEYYRASVICLVYEDPDNYYFILLYKEVPKHWKHPSILVRTELQNDSFLPDTEPLRAAMATGAAIARRMYADPFAKKEEIDDEIRNLELRIFRYARQQYALQIGSFQVDYKTGSIVYVADQSPKKMEEPIAMSDLIVRHDEESDEFVWKDEECGQDCVKLYDLYIARTLLSLHGIDWDTLGDPDGKSVLLGPGSIRLVMLSEPEESPGTRLAHLFPHLNLSDETNENDWACFGGGMITIDDDNESALSFGADDEFSVPCSRSDLDFEEVSESGSLSEDEDDDDVDDGIERRESEDEEDEDGVELRVQDQMRLLRNAVKNMFRDPMSLSVDYNDKKLAGDLYELMRPFLPGGLFPKPPARDHTIQSADDGSSGTNLKRKHPS